MDVKLVLESLKHDHTAVGCWVHVIGYVTSIAKVPDNQRHLYSSVNVGVQALLLWPADDLDISSYERSLEGQD